MFVNPKMAKMLGYTVDEMVGKSFFDFCFEDDFDGIRSRHNARFKGDSKGYEFRFKSKDNQVVWTYISASPLFNEGSYVGSLGMITDITEQKSKEQARQEQERRYRSLFENSPVPIWDEDFSFVKQYIDKLKKSGIEDIREYFESNMKAVSDCFSLLIINDVNKAVLELNEAPSKEYMLNNYSELADAKLIEYAINQFEAIAEGKKSCEFDAELKTFTGKTVHVRLKWTVVSGYEDTYEKVYLSMTELTDRIKSENETLKKSNQQQELLLREIHHRVKNNLQII